jgi:pimeloyl-ACP methyl ester carboxylesterase
MQKLDRGDGIHLAWDLVEGHGPTIVFLPGFKSDMSGEKATALRDYCSANGYPMLRLDYSGHGASEGAFADGTIGRWMEDARLVIEHAAPGPVILVGSSMGGWIALLLGRAMGPRLLGLVGIAAAPDFTETLIWAHMEVGTRASMYAYGFVDRPSNYGDRIRITLNLIEEGRNHLLLNHPIPITAPVRLLQGQRDDDVPWQTALTIAERLTSTDVQITLIKDGDHRLSREDDIGLLCATVAGLLVQNGA